MSEADEEEAAHEEAVDAADFDEEEMELTFWGHAYDFFQKHRLRASKFVLAGFLIAVVVTIGGAVPRDVEVDYRFPDHEDVVEARLEYAYEGEHVREVTLRWRDGAPRIVRDTVELSPGDYDVSVLLVAESGAMREFHGAVSAPADGVVRVRLQP